MLRTCNVLRIARLPVLRNDGAPGRRTPRLARAGKGGFEARPYAPPGRHPRPNPRL
ncbi:MAG: hypothetical protein LBM98_01290 [Oscillospiraceae bacterium]|nr:hypothetical protein [Oscillospiraceae bacterium]